MNFYETSFLFFAFLGLLHGIFFLMRKKGDSIANRFLGVYLLLFAFNLTFNSLFWSELLYTKDYIHFFGLNAMPWLCYGPLFFLYQKRAMTRKKIKTIELCHFIPLVVYISAKSPFYIMSAQDKLAALADGSYIEYGFSTIKTAHFAIVLMVIYGAFTIRYRVLNKAVVPLEKKVWLNYLTLSFFGYLLCITTVFARIEFGYYSVFSDYIICYFIVFFVGSVVYFGIVQPQVFEGSLPMNKVIPFVKYGRTGLSSNYSLELKKQLEALMENEKPYLDSDIRLDDLAQILDIPRHHASQVINKHFRSNFYDFINGYRVKEAELVLKEFGEKITIQKVAYRSGFNNRTSFYKAFKKVNGITPKEYRELNIAS